MSLSRGGFELSEIWEQQRTLVEADVRLRGLERRARASGSHEDRAHYARELVRLGRHDEVDGALGDDNPHRKEIVGHIRKSGLHDEADKVHLGPHARRLATASRALHEVRRKSHKHWQTRPAPDHTKTDEIEANEDRANEAMDNARTGLHAAIGRALQARGDKNPMRKASTASGRYRVILAHGAKHLPKTDNWHHEHSLLMDYHNGTSLTGNPEPRDTGGGVFESDAAKHSFLHTLVNRHPNIRAGHATGEDSGQHHVFVHLERRKTTPAHHQGGSVRDHDTNSTVTGPNYLASHPPHRHAD